MDEHRPGAGQLRPPGEPDAGSLIQSPVFTGSDSSIQYETKAFTDFGGGTSGRWTFTKPLPGKFDFTFFQQSIVGPGQVLDPGSNSGGIIILTRTSGSVPVLRGDGTGDGTANNDDVTKVRLAVGSSTTVRPTLYSVWADLDGDGKIAANDLTMANARA